MQHYIVNVEGVIARDGRYLMTVRGAEESHAPGTLSVPGGKVEGAGFTQDILEETLRREIREEVGIEVDDELVYLESKAFVSDNGQPVVDVVFLCRYLSGEPTALDPAEVADIAWMTATDVAAHPKCPPWIRQNIELAEVRRSGQRAG